MPARTLVRGFLSLYAVVGVVVLVESLQTVWAATHGGFSEPDRTHALILGGLESLAAVAFLLPRTMHWGAAALLAIFAIAFTLHSLQGHPPLTLLVYAAAVLFVRLHGVAGYRWTDGSPA
jgi:hypothetical protein